MMINNQQISVIIPCYQHEAFLPNRLESILIQTHASTEIFIFDDCSKDNSIEIVKNYTYRCQHIQVHLNEVNSGNTFFQWKRAVELCNGKYIWIAESDDVASANFLERMKSIMEENPEVNICFCQSWEINEYGQITGDWLFHTNDIPGGSIFHQDFVMDGKEFISKFLVHKNVIPNASAVLIRNQKELSGLITVDPLLRTCGDWLFYFRICLNGKVAFVSDKLNYFRRHNSSAIALASKQNKSVLNTIEITLRKAFQKAIELKNKSDYRSAIKINRRKIRRLQVQNLYNYFFILNNKS